MKQVGTVRLLGQRLTLLAALASLTPLPGHAQDAMFIEASETGDVGYGDTFKKAEEALLAGLSRGQDSRESSREVVAPSAPAKQPSEPATTIVRKKGPVPVIQEPVEQPNTQVVEPASIITQPSEQKTSKSTPAVSVLQKKLTTSEMRVRALEQQLSEAKSQLSAAEVEINRLSAIIGAGSRARFAPQSTAPVAARSVRPTTPPAPIKDVPAPSPSNDMDVATIAVDKADLRLGPGKNNSALMTLPRGSRLAVEARSGEWYRVFAPNGQRAWIHSSLVRFGQGSSSLNDGSSVTVRGFDPSVRTGAFTNGK